MGREPNLPKKIGTSGKEEYKGYTIDYYRQPDLQSECYYHYITIYCPDGKCEDIQSGLKSGWDMHKAYRWIDNDILRIEHEKEEKKKTRRKRS